MIVTNTSRPPGPRLRWPGPPKAGPRASAGPLPVGVNLPGPQALPCAAVKFLTYSHDPGPQFSELLIITMSRKVGAQNY